MIPAEAKTCPHCRKPQGWTTCAKVGLGAILIIFIPVLMNIGKPTSPSKHADPYSAPRGACRMALEKTLHDPGSAEFDLGSNWYVETRKDGTILVQPKLRAKNAFGAYRYVTYNCIVKPEGENIRVLSLKQIN